MLSQTVWCFERYYQCQQKLHILNSVRKYPCDLQFTDTALLYGIIPTEKKKNIHKKRKTYWNILCFYQMVGWKPV